MVVKAITAHKGSRPHLSLSLIQVKTQSELPQENHSYNVPSKAILSITENLHRDSTQPRIP
jgi:hypothetical protein